MGRRWNRDPKPNASISCYATFSNNPNYFTDVNGDTVKTSGIAGIPGLSQAYSKFSQSEAGKAFLRDYEIGGKYENVTLNFGEDKLNGPQMGYTEAYSVDPITGKRLEILSPEYYNYRMAKGADMSNSTVRLEKGDNLQFDVNVADLTKGDKELKKINFNNGLVSENYSTSKMSINFLHEGSHVKLMHASLLKSNAIHSSSIQHSMMEKPEYFLPLINMASKQYGYLNYYINSPNSKESFFEFIINDVNQGIGVQPAALKKYKDFFNQKSK